MPSVVRDAGRLRESTAGMAERAARISSALRGLWALRTDFWIVAEPAVSWMKREVEGFSAMTPLNAVLDLCVLGRQ